MIQWRLFSLLSSPRWLAECQTAYSWWYKVNATTSLPDVWLFARQWLFMKVLKVRHLFTEAGVLNSPHYDSNGISCTKDDEECQQSAQISPELNKSAGWVMKLRSTWIHVLQKVTFEGFSEFERTCYGRRQRKDTSHSLLPAASRQTLITRPLHLALAKYWSRVQPELQQPTILRNKLPRGMGVGQVALQNYSHT